MGSGGQTHAHAHTRTEEHTHRRTAMLHGEGSLNTTLKGHTVLRMHSDDHTGEWMEQVYLISITCPNIYMCVYVRVCASHPSGS